MTAFVKPQQFPIARTSAGHAPLRRPGSIRRTTSIDSDWPEGWGKPWEMIGRARDLYTPADGSPAQVLAAAQFRLMSSPQREIMSLETDPDHPGVPGMIGVRAGAASRGALVEHMGDIVGTPLFQVLDDFAGASLVAGWIWTRWMDNWHERTGDGSKLARRSMVAICTGFAPGGSAFAPDGVTFNPNQSSAEVGPLEHPDDPLSWHTMPFQKGPQKRRSRRIDLWREGDVIRVDAAFQDSGSTPDGGRVAVHEYRVYAEVAAATGELLSLQALPMILPYAECPGASVKASRLVGTQTADLRQTVIDELRSTLGCTHLNDVLRALADVPALARQLG